MKKTSVIIVLAGLSIALVAGFLLPKKGVETASIAIVLTLSHPALEEVHDGFIRALSNTHPDIRVIEYNAQGNMQQANLIAQQVAQNTNLIGVLAIGTLAAQTVAKAERKKPIVIAAVSDPSVIQPDNHAQNVCGLSDSIDAEFQISTILELLPNLKRVSLLYSPHEENSSSMVKRLLPIAQGKKLDVRLVGVDDPQQIAQASMRACQLSEVVLIPLDNQLVAAMPSVIKATKALGCAVIASNESPIHQGATLAFGVNYYRSGAHAGELMGQIIDGKKTPQDIGFINPEEVSLYVNERVLKEKNLTLAPAASTKTIPIDGV